MASVRELSDLDPGDQKEYVKRARELSRSVTLKNEMHRLRETAGESIIRHASTPEEVAWHRGGLHYLEAIEKRLEYLSNLK